MSQEQKPKVPTKKSEVTIYQPESSSVLSDKKNKLSNDIQAFKKKDPRKNQINSKAVVVSPDNEKPTSCFDFFKSPTKIQNSERTPLTLNPVQESNGFGYKA